MQNCRQRQNKRGIWFCIDMISFVNGWTHLDDGILEWVRPEEPPNYRSVRLKDRKIWVKKFKTNSASFLEGSLFFPQIQRRLLTLVERDWLSLSLSLSLSSSSFYFFYFFKGLASGSVRFLLLKLNQISPIDFWTNFTLKF